MYVLPTRIHYTHNTHNTHTNPSNSWHKLSRTYRMLWSATQQWCSICSKSMITLVIWCCGSPGRATRHQLCHRKWRQPQLAPVTDANEDANELYRTQQPRTWPPNSPGAGSKLPHAPKGQHGAWSAVVGAAVIRRGTLPGIQIPPLYSGTPLSSFTHDNFFCTSLFVLDLYYSNRLVPVTISIGYRYRYLHVLYRLVL